MDKSDIQELIEKLENYDDDYWNRSVERLGRIGKPVLPHVIDILLTCEDDDYGFVQGFAMEVIVKIGHDPLTVSKMIEALKNENSFVRYSATYILGELEDKSAVPYLFDGFNDVENAYGGSVGSETARALGKLGDISAVPYLLAELKERDPETEMESVNALIKLVPKLIEERKYTTALEVIKECTAAKMEYFRELDRFKKNRVVLKRKRDELGVLASYAQQIHDKMNPDNKKFPVKHQPVRRTQARKVMTNG